MEYANGLPGRRGLLLRNLYARALFFDSCRTTILNGDPLTSTGSAYAASVGETVHVIPWEAFYLAISGRYFEKAPQSFTDEAAPLLAGQANDPAVVGFEADLDTTVDDFSGDLFIVVFDPKAFEDSTGGLYLEARQFFVAAVELSGKTPWLASNPRFVLSGGLGSAVTSLPSSRHCCAKAGQVEDVACRDDGGAPGCGGGTFLCKPSVNEIATLPLMAATPTFRSFTEVFAEGCGLNILPSGRFAAHLSLYDQRSTHYEDSFGMSEAGITVEPDGRLAPPPEPFCPGPPKPGEPGYRGPATAFCDYCELIDCEPGGDYTTITDDPNLTPPPTTCSQVVDVPEECLLFSGPPELLPMQCGGNCPNCFQPSEEVCMGGPIGPPTSSLVQSAFPTVSPQDLTGCGSTLPSFCQYVVSGTSDVCTCDAACEAERLAFDEMIRDCHGQSLQFCEEADGTVCIEDVVSGTEICRTCNANGECTKYASAGFAWEIYADDEDEEDGTSVYNCHTTGCIDCGTPAVTVVCVSKSPEPEDTNSDGSNASPNKPTKSVPGVPAPKKRSQPTDGEGGQQTVSPSGVAVNQADRIRAADQAGLEDGRRLLDRLKAEELAKLVEADKAPDLETLLEGVDEMLEEIPDDVDQIEAELAAAGKGADPVDLSSGALEVVHKDISIPGPVRSLFFERKYTSTKNRRSILGSNWTHNWDVRLRVIKQDTAPSWAPKYCKTWHTEATCILLRRDSRASLYIRDPFSNIFLPQSGRTSSIQQVGNQWILKTKDRGVQTFNVEGHLVDVRDRFGNGFRNFSSIADTVIASGPA